MEKKEKIEIFKPKDRELEFQIVLDEGEDTVWVTEDQMVALFEKGRRTIGGHIKNIYAEGELDKGSTWRQNRQVQIEGERKVERKVSYYNLDIIISVGYRVKSPSGVEFRKWATSKLKEYLVKGYAIDRKRLLNQSSKIKELEVQVSELNQLIVNTESQLTDGFLKIIEQYTKSFELLNKFDTETLSTDGLKERLINYIDYKSVRIAIDELKRDLVKKKEASSLFGNEKDDSFRGILASISQTVFGEFAYPTIEEQAAQLLYSIIKGHSFNDGNKRIGSFIFVWFLEQNGYHLKATGEKKINDNTLVALALAVAQSSPDQRELIIKLIINLIKN